MRGQAGSVPGMSVFSSGISLSGLENFSIWTLQSGYHPIWTAMIQLLAKSMPKLWETLCFAIFALFFQNSSPFRISETGLKFSLKDPRRNWSRNRARMINWSHLKRLLVLSEPSIGLLLYRLEVKRGCNSHKVRWGICLVCMIFWPRRIWFMAKAFSWSNKILWHGRRPSQNMSDSHLFFKLGYGSAFKLPRSC